MIPSLPSRYSDCIGLVVFRQIDYAKMIQLADLAPCIQQLRQQQEQLKATRWEMEQQLSDRRVELADAETVAQYVAEMRMFADT